MDEKIRMYRPLVLTSYAINYYLGNNNLFGYHLFNILLHAINSIILYLILLFFSKGENHIVSLIGAAIYAVNPINSETVNYMSARSALMATTFYIISFYLFIRSTFQFQISNFKFQIFFIISLLSFALALLTKEITITLPLILLLYDYLLNKSSNFKLTIRYHLPFWAVAIIYLVIRKSLMGATGISKAMPTGQAPMGVAGDLSRTVVYQLTQLKVLLNYIKLWFLPVNLNVNHAYPVINSLWMPSLWVAISIVMLIILFIIVLLLRKQMVLAFFLLWFFICHLPTSLLPLNVTMAENRIYLPGIGLAGFLAAATEAIAVKRKFSRGKNLILLFSALFITITLSIGTVARNRIWKDEFTLWSDSIKKSPHSWWSYQWLGDAHRKKGEFDKAIDLYLIALKMNPYSFRTYNSLALAYNDNGQYTEAYLALKKAIEIRPDFAEAHYNLGNFYSRIKKYDQAIEAYQEALKIRPHFSEAHNNLGNVYLILKDYKKALQEYKLALDANPQNDNAYQNLENLKHSLGVK